MASATKDVVFGVHTFAVTTAARTRIGLAAVLLYGAGCAGGMRAPDWPAGSSAVQGSAGSLAVSESHVPRVRCYDGSTSISSCSPQRPHELCCANEGGVYRDAWGNAVAD